MKQRRLVGIALLISFLCIPLAVFANNKPKPRSRACVACGFNAGHCKSCVPGGSSYYCETLNCGACELDGEGECSGGIGGILQSSQISSNSKPSIKLSTNIIREIAAKHARFAITLAEMNVYEITPGHRSVYWTPVKLSSSDIEAFLNKGAHSRFFKRYNKEARRLNVLIEKGELSDIVYAISIEQAEEGTWSIKMQVQNEEIAASVDPAYSKLEIKVIPAQRTLSSVEQQPSRKRETWEIH